MTDQRPRSTNELRWDQYVGDWHKTVDKVRKQSTEEDTIADSPFRNTLAKDGMLKYPGDEWGAGLESNWQVTFHQLFPVAEIGEWSHVVEIGAGGGKYTEFVFAENPDVNIVCLDVSSKFLEILRDRFSDKYQKQLFTYHIDATTPFPIEDAIAKLNWPKLDAVVSIDAMVHVDLQYLMSYLISAGRCLKPNGYLILTLADCTTPEGFKKLIRETPSTFLSQGRPTAKFEWLAPSAIKHILTELGFKIVILESPARDLHLVARLEQFNPEIEKILGATNSVSKGRTSSDFARQTHDYTLPQGLKITDDLLETNVTVMSEIKMVTVSDLIQSEPNQWLVKNQVIDAWSVLAQSPTTPLQQGTLLVAQGQHRAGNLRFRVVRAKNWKQEYGTMIDMPGDFRVAIQIPETDEYVLQLTTGRETANDYTITRMGWVTPKQ